MSRSGYSDDCENIGLWRGAVHRATVGRRGQALLKAVLGALDAMAVRELAGGSFQESGGCMCTLGVLGATRGIDLRSMEVAAYDWDFEKIGNTFGSARALVQEIMWMNDEGNWRGNETPAERWQRMRGWVSEQIVAPEVH